MKMFRAKVSDSKSTIDGVVGSDCISNIFAQIDCDFFNQQSLSYEFGSLQASITNNFCPSTILKADKIIKQLVKKSSNQCIRVKMILYSM